MRSSRTTENWKVSEGTGGDPGLDESGGQGKGWGQEARPRRGRAQGRRLGEPRAQPSPSSVASPPPSSDPDHRPITAAGEWESRLGHPAAPRLGHCPRQWRLHILHQVRTVLRELWPGQTSCPAWCRSLGEGLLGDHLSISLSVSSISQAAGKIPFRLLRLPFLQPHHCGVRLQQPTV